MNNSLVKKVLPHLIAVVVFIVVAALFCKPVLDGNVLNQHDTIGWKGMAQNSFEYKERTGHFPLWNPNLFSGMPNYQVAMDNKSVLPDVIKIFSLGLPKPINFFFLASICFYILCLSLNIRPVLGILAGLAYAYSTYNPVIIFAGHETQMLATSFLPLLIAGLILIYEKKYWLGLAITTMATNLEIGVNHLQISYYGFLIAAIITIGYIINWIMKKEWKHMVIAGSVVAVAAITGIAASAITIMTTSEYSKFTMRGGKNVEITSDTVKAVKTSGLDTAYAWIYSLGKAETGTLIMPNAFGGGSSNRIDDSKSKAIDKLVDKGMDESTARQIVGPLPKYWGALPYTAGPAYLGVIICLMGVIGFVIIKKPIRWALLAATLLGILMAWGKHLTGFNLFLFENLPFYNKFRAPSMAQTIPQFTVGVIAVLALQKLLFDQNNKDTLKKEFRNILYATGAIFGVLGLMYLSIDYRSPLDNGGLYDYLLRSTKSDEAARIVLSGLREDRKAMFGGQVLRTLGFAMLLIGMLWLHMKNYLSSLAVSIILMVISTLELTLISINYLSEKNEAYVPADTYDSANFSPSIIDQQIKQDTDPNFRVFNIAADTYNESKTSYFHKSVGGYHPAKLRIYQDIIEKYLSGRPNPGILNMLNTRYIIVEDPQSGQPGLIKNPDAYGPCWLVKNVKLVDGPVASLQETGKTNLKDTAIVDASFSKNVIQPQWDSASSIKMVKYDNDAIEYEANCNGPQFAVFSEVYYPKGWNAYIDGKQTEYCNTNYVLRGLSVPAGKHVIKFVFEPASYRKGSKIGFIASILIVLFFIGGLFMTWREYNKKEKKLSNK